MRRNPRRAEVDPQHPAGWATSDRNGHIGNLKNMRWQHEWRGSTIVNTRVLVHEDELDEPQRQLGTLVIPPDPPPLMNARPENYSIDEEPISTRYTIGPDGYASLIRVIINNEPWYSNRIVLGEGANTPVGPTGTPGVPGLYSGVVSTTGSVNVPVHAAMPADSGAFVLTGNAATLSYVASDPASAFLARTSGLDATHTNAYTALINGLVADGVWTKFDVLYILATQDSTTALLNLVSSTYNGIVHGSPGFVADRGYTGVDGSGADYIATSFIPSSAPSPNFVRDSAHVSVWSNTNIETQRIPIGTAVTGTSKTAMHLRFTDGNAYFYINGPITTTGVAVADSLGHYIANRSGASAWQGYKNGSSITTGTEASQIVSTSEVVGLAYNGPAGIPDLGDPRQITMMSIGASLSGTDVTNFYARLRTFMTTVGVP